ncbi:MAG: hypothetical protein ACLFWB_13305 [Armatimonadota bacterium]
MRIKNCALAVAVLLLLLVGTASVAQDQGFNTELPDTYIIYQHIELLERLNDIQFTSAQAAELAAEIEAPYTELQELWQQETSQKLYEVLKGIRDQMITGRVSEEAWLAVVEARGTTVEEEEALGEDPIEQKKAALADEIARAFLKALTDAQIAAITQSGPERTARDFLEELDDMRGAPPNDWTDFKSEMIAEIMEHFEDVAEDTGTLRTDIKAFLDRVRNMGTDAYYQQRVALRSELIDIVTAARQVGPNEEEVRVLNRLAELAEVRDLLQLLQAMAAADRQFAALQE